MHDLEQLLSAARVITAQVSVRFQGSPEADQWVCTVSAGDAILFESTQGSLDFIIEEAALKLKSMVTKVRNALAEAPVDEEDFGEDPKEPWDPDFPVK